MRSNVGTMGKWALLGPRASSPQRSCCLFVCGLEARGPSGLLVVQRNHLSSESGIFLPLTAIIITTLLFIVVALGVDAKRGKEARALGQLKADEICNIAARELPFMRKSVEKLAQLATDGFRFSSYARAKTLRIVAPTSFINLNNPNPRPPEPYRQGITPLTAVSADLTCSNIECTFAGDVTVTDASQNYPAGFWDDYDYNAYLGCEIDVEYDTLLGIFGTKKQIALAKSVWRSEISGATPNSRGGIFFGISPYVEYVNDDLRFKITDPGFTNSNVNRGWPTFPPGPRNRAFTRQRNARLDPLAFGRTLSDTPALGLNDGSRQELLNQKYNLYLAARNELLYSLAERMGRHARTRNNSGMLLLSPKNQGVAPVAPNPPIWLARYGDDITQRGLRGFVMPYISYDHNGTRGSRPDDRLCPYQHPLCRSASPQMMVASQLRDGFYVNNRLNGVRTISDPRIFNDDFEDDRWFDSRDRVARAYRGMPADLYWDQDPNRLQDRVSIPELLRWMPGAEECPYVWAEGANPPVEPRCDETQEVAGPSVHRDSSADLPGAQGAPGLQPDIVSFLQVANGVASALDAKSLHLSVPLNTTFRPPPQFPNTDNTSMVLLFTSKRLDPSQGMPTTPADITAATASQEMQDIRNQVLALNAVGRSVFVIFMPVTEIDTRDEVMIDFQWAFNADPNADVVSSNFIFKIGPTGCPEYKYDPAGNPGDPYFPNDETTCFRDYWQDVLLGGAAGNISEIADNISRLIFVPRLTF